MPIRIPLFLFFATVISTQIGRAEDDLESLKPSAWAGFPNGTWVVFSNKLYRGEKLQRARRERRIQIADPLQKDFFYEIYWERDGQFTDGPIYSGRATFPGTSPDFQLKASRNETLEIEGKKYSCTVKKFVFIGEDQDREESVTYWFYKDDLVPCREINQEGKEVVAPSNALRMEYSRKDTRKEVTTVVQIVSLEDKVEIGGRRYVCVREEGTIESRRGMEKTSGKMQHWLSNDVPGHEVKLVAEGVVNGTKAYRRKEIEDIYVPKLKP